MKNSFLVKSDFINSRLDRWIRKNVCEIPQSLIEKNIRKGNIKINKKVKKSSYKLQKDDTIYLYNINFDPKKNKKKTDRYKATDSDISDTNSMFVEDNENFCVINKPSGIAVQLGTKSRKNVLDILRYCNEFKDSTPYIVHRIDKETTGLLIVAKNRKFAQLFTSLFRIRKIHKTYLGIVLGSFEKKKGTLKDELIYYEGEKKIKTNAITHYNVLDSNNNYSLLKLNPETGRKHQLRRQMLMYGHPIIGDSKYRISSSNLSKKQSLMLHAYKINFSINNHKYKFTTEPPSVFKKFLKEKYLKTF